MRETIVFNQGWDYTPEWQDKFIEPSQKAEGFTKVNLPHANKEIPYNYFDEKDYQFVSCYRKVFSFDPSWNGKRVYVDFDAV